MSDVIERLRAANPVPDCPPPPIEKLWRRVELDEQRQHTTGRGPAYPEPPRRRPTIGGVAAAVLTVGALATAVLAIALLAHHRPGASSPGGSAATTDAHPAEATLSSAGALGARVRALRGSPIVIEVWASWCNPCRNQLRFSEPASARYHGQVVFLAADADDTAAAARSFLAHHPLSYPSYPVTLKQLRNSIPSIAVLPTTIFVNSAGRIVYVRVGEYPSVAALNHDIATSLAPPAPAPVRTVPPRLAAVFAVFRRTANPADALPVALADRLMRGPDADLGLNPTLARRIGGLQHPAYLVPGKDGIGLYSAAGGGTYVPYSDAIDGGLLGESFRPRAPEVVTGVVPDGVRKVTFELTGGATQTVRVHGNLYQARLHHHATTMTFIGPAGRVSVNL
jgi:cytochrome c biogenesis protein CcmG, thiol:disulfide interchange protein DsbE